MTHQRVLRFLVALAAILAFSIAPIENTSSSAADFSLYIAFASFITILLACAVAIFGFSKMSRSANKTNTALIATMPFAIGSLLYLFRVEPNVHGAFFISIFLYTVISELTVLILLIRLRISSA